MHSLPKIPAIMSWSGGKDSSFALYKVLEEGLYDVKYLLSTINGEHKRLLMHGVRETLIEEQSRLIGIPLLKVYVYEPNNAEYEWQMSKVLTQAASEGIQTILFGDIFLEDLRAYREEKMKQLDMHCVFPIWKVATRQLVNDFIKKGFKTVTCCINDGYLDETWVGRLIDESFVSDLPKNADPCGENGEFHSFCYAGPLFRNNIPISVGEKTYKQLPPDTGNHPTSIKDVGTKGFWYCDITMQ
jgi:uncharacterized protein (TIGR00290 family)